jgi:type III restriction enzyme
MRVVVRAGALSGIGQCLLAPVYRGVVRKYRPDFLIRLQSGTYLVLETKGRDTEQDRTKRRFLEQWVQAVNTHDGFGLWA